MSFSCFFELELGLEFPHSVSNISSFSITSFIYRTCVIIVLLLNLLKYFTERSILDIWWEPKSTYDSIHVCSLEFIDDT